MHKKIRMFTYSLVYSIISIGNRAYAAFTFKNPIQATSFDQVVLGFAKLLAQVGLPIAAIFLVWSGFLFVTARGDDKKLTDAKNTFYWTILGTALIVGAYAIATAVVNFAKQL
mgnify:CR=1 FL=1